MTTRSKIGPIFEKHDTFPAKTNTEFVQVVDETRENARLKRGAGCTGVRYGRAQPASPGPKATSTENASSSYREDLWKSNGERATTK